MLSKARKLLLCTLLLACVLSSTTAAVIDEDSPRSVRILENPDEKNVTFQTTLIGSELADIVWCGANKESVLVVTEGGVVYYSNNGGLEWKKLKNIFQKAGQQVSEEDDVTFCLVITEFDFFYCHLTDRNSRIFKTKPLRSPVSLLPWLGRNPLGYRRLRKNN